MLLVEHGNLEAASSGALVLTHDLTGLARATDGGAVALVSELSLSSKLGLDTTHVAVQGSLSTTASRLLGDLLLDLVEVLEKAHAAIWRVRHDHASLLHINRLDGAGATDVVPRANEFVGPGGVAAGCQHSLGITICRDVHH